MPEYYPIDLYNVTKKNAVLSVYFSHARWNFIEYYSHDIKLPEFARQISPIHIQFAGHGGNIPAVLLIQAGQESGFELPHGRRQPVAFNFSTALFFNLLLMINPFDIGCFYHAGATIK